MFTSDYTDKFLAAIENLGLTKKQLLQADKDKSCEKLNKILNKLDKASLVNLTSQLAVYSYKARIEAAKNLDNTTAMFEKIVKTLNDTHLFLNDDEKKTARRKQAKRGGETKRDNNKPMQDAKTEIKQKWLNERETIIARRGKAQFCRDMQNQYKKDGNDLIKDTKTILGWISDWEAELLQK